MVQGSLSEYHVGGPTSSQPGLSGPARGVGGPSSQMMAPGAHASAPPMRGAPPSGYGRGGGYQITDWFLLQ